MVLAKMKSLSANLVHLSYYEILLVNFHKQNMIHK